MHLDEVALAARKGGNAVLVWLAVRAWEGYADGASATVPRIVEITGLSSRTVRWAVAALVEVGMLKRDGRKICGGRLRGTRPWGRAMILPSPPQANAYGADRSRSVVAHDHLVRQGPDRCPDGDRLRGSGAGYPTMRWTSPRRCRSGTGARVTAG